MGTPLPDMVIEIVRNDLGQEWDHNDDRLIELIQAVGTLGVRCLDFSPREQ